MADYQLLSGPGYGMSDSVLEDSGLMGSYGPPTSPEASALLPGSIHQSSVMPGMMQPQPAVQPGQSSYHQMGYQQNQVPQKFPQYAATGGYGGMGASQYGMGSRLHHIPDVSSQLSASGGQLTSYPPHQTLSNNRYTPRQQFSVQVAQQNAQYSTPYSSLHPQQSHTSAATSDMWQTAPQSTPQQGYLHPSGFPTQQPSPAVQRVVKGSTYVPDDYIGQQPASVPSMQRKPTFSSQPSPNGPPHLGQTAGSQALTHIPVSQTGQAYSSQGPYGTTNSQSTIVRPHYGSASPVGSVQHPAAVMTSSRPMHRLPYTSLHPQVSSSQQSSPARMQQYTYPTSQPYSVQSSVGDSSTPPHLSPYPQAAPSSPQYRGAVYPPSMSLSPRQPTPPAGSPLPSSSRTPDRVIPPQAPTTPQSQGSYPSPSGGHISSSPGQQVLSPNAPSSSLQQLEQMVMPSNSVKASQSSSGLCTGMLGNSYFSSQPQARSPVNSQSMTNRSYPHMTPHQHQYSGPATAGQLMVGSPAYVPNAGNQIEDISSSQSVYSTSHSSSLQQVVSSHNSQESNRQYQSSMSTYQNGLYSMAYQTAYGIPEDKKPIETQEMVLPVCAPTNESPTYPYNANQYQPPEPVRSFNEETSDEPVYVELQPATQFHSVLDIVPQSSAFSPEPLSIDPPPPVSSSIPHPVELPSVLSSETLPLLPEPTLFLDPPEIEEVKPAPPKKAKITKPKKPPKSAKIVMDLIEETLEPQADSSNVVEEPSFVDSTLVVEEISQPRKATKKRKTEPKEPKPKKPKKAKVPKEPKKAKSKKPIVPPVPQEMEEKENMDGKESTSGEQTEREDQPEKKATKKKGVPKEPKTRSPPKKKLPKLGIKFGKKKKRKRFGSSENSDVERTPLPSPDEDDGIQKRRSARNTKRKKYIDDIDMDITDDDELLDSALLRNNPDGPAVQVLTNVSFDEIMVVDKILAVRTAVKEDDMTNEKVEVEEFYIKYKNLSYLHCEWRTQEEIEAADKRVIQKLKRFRQKRESISNIFDFLEEELFNPDYVEVDRILECTDAVEEVDNSIDGIARETVDAMIRNIVGIVDNGLDIPYDRTRKNKHYLVKWRALAYEDSTWELEDDLDPDKIRQFIRFRNPPPKEKWKPKRRPKPSDWVKLEESPIYKGANNLREYQLEGLSWLTFCWYHGQNCILADEMGLGKTIQSLTFLDEICKYGIPGPFLVIAPLSTIGNWQREFETWTDINVITYHGSSASRNMIQEYEMYYKTEKNERIKEIYKFQVMITTFEIILTDYMELREIPWRCVIIDEAHRLKNRNCKLLEGLRMMNSEHRVLLTGTPLQNNVEELFSLLNFLEPNRFASTEAFMEEFGDLKTEHQVDKLKALLKPMMLRRLKEDVEKSLAPKEETIVEVELTNIQKKYYRAILERNFAFLTKGGTSSNTPNLMNTMMELRKCCIHPFLIKGAEEQILLEHRNQYGDTEETSLNAMIQASGKLVLIDKLLTRLKANGHRVLIFSQMVRCLDILEDFLVHRRYPYERIDGRVRGNLRQAAIDRFCKPDSDRFVFLLCTRAGGLGINLTAADTVIIFDSDWNPQNDLQAQARCHRIGQSKAVKVYRLICRNTYEREMFDKASLKLGLDKAVLQSMNAQKENIGVNQQLSKKEIEDLLRKGAYGALMDDDNAGDKFCEEDIDQILERRTRVITLEGGTKGSTFAKATFSSSNNCTDIEIDDPNFWEKWAKRANLDVDDLKNKNELIVQEPRRRTQTRRFGADDNLLDLSELESSDDDDDVSSRTRAGRGRSGGRNNRKGGGSRNRKSIYDREREEDLLEEIAPGNWTRAECFKVEKGLLTFGWGRWEECMALAHFRRCVSIKDVEDISRTVLLYCLQHYRGDEKIKGFIWDLITPNDDGEMKVYKNHSGLSAPVPRGRKGKKLKKDLKPSSNALDVWAEWAKEDHFNPDFLLNDEGYKRHLHRHANKVLLRVRLLYYLKHEVIGELHHQVVAGIPASEISLPAPAADGEPPCSWWDEECDRSILIGVYKHGYERYNVMRQDPTLCFLVRCGPPDGAALLAEMHVIDDDFDEKQKDLLDLEEPVSPSTTDPATPQSFVDVPISTPTPTLPAEPGEMGKLPFPSVTDLNTRLRRIITGYQRTFKKQELKLAQRVRRIERREKFEAAIREREIKKRELQQRIWWPFQTPPVESSSSYLNRRWSRREEADFYRTISSYGVEYDSSSDTYNWSRFRAIGRLERKVDETLTEYFKSFFAMCKRVCGRKLTEEEEHLPMMVEQISEERASRCLQKIELLSKIREEILFNPQLDERLKLCQPSMDLPDWWQCGKHDKDLLIGAAKYGLARLDYHLLHDPDLSFRDVLKTNTSKLGPTTSEEKRAAEAIEKVKECIEDVIKESAEKAEAAEREAAAESKAQQDVKEELSDAVTAMDTEEEVVKEEDTSIEDQDALVESVKSEVDQEMVEEKPPVSDMPTPCIVPKEEMMTEEPVVPIKEEHASGVEESQTDEAEPLPPEFDHGEPTVAQLLAQTARLPIRWPKDKVLQIRLEHVCHAIEKNEWPVIRPTFLHGFPLLTSNSLSPSPHPSSPVPSSTPTNQSESTGTPRATPEPQSTLSTEVCTAPSPVSSIMADGIKVPRRRRRRRRFEIEAERAKLRAILSHTMQQQLQQQFLAPPPPSPSLLRVSMREEHSASEDAAALPRTHSSAPPPAHQNSAPRMTTALGTLDLSVKSTPSSAAVGASVLTNSAVETGFSPSSPMDLSSNSAATVSAPSQVSSQSQKQGAANGSARVGRGRGRLGGSRIDALALGLQARKQQEILEQQKHHPLLENDKYLGKKGHKDVRHDGGESTEDEIKLPKLKMQNESRSKNHDLGLKSSTSNAGSNLPFIVSQTAAIRQDLKRWLEEHPEVIATNPNLAAAAAMAFNPLPSVPLHTELLELPDSRRRGRRPRIDPTKLDYERITGEENISVINRLTGKKGNLPDTLHKRIVTPSDKRGRRTAASLLSSAHQNSVNSPAYSSASSSSALNPLNFSNSGLLSGFPGMKLFMDPPKTGSNTVTTSSSSTTSSTPPIFLPFGGLAGMGLTNPLFGFSGFSFPGLQGPLGLDTDMHRKERSKEKGSGSSRNKTASSSLLTSSSVATPTTSSVSASAGISSSSLPFLYPTPSLLYNPLGLSSFALPPNMPASFATLAQAGLMNGLGSLCSTNTTTPTTSSSIVSSLTTPISLGGLGSLPKSKATIIPPPPASSLMDSDDESLKSLMENHDDDDLDDDLDDDKLDTADSDLDDLSRNEELDYSKTKLKASSSDQAKKESKLDRPTSAEENPS